MTIHWHIDAKAYDTNTDEFFIVNGVGIGILLDADMNIHDMENCIRPEKFRKPNHSSSYQRKWQFNDYVVNIKDNEYFSVKDIDGEFLIDEYDETQPIHHCRLVIPYNVQHTVPYKWQVHDCAYDLNENKYFIVKSINSMGLFDINNTVHILDDCLQVVTAEVIQRKCPPKYVWKINDYAYDEDTGEYFYVDGIENNFIIDVENKKHAIINCKRMIAAKDNAVDQDDRDTDIKPPNGVEKQVHQLDDGTPIKAGKYYTCENGNKVFILTTNEYILQGFDNYAIAAWNETTEQPCNYASNGTIKGFPDFNIVSEWTEPAGDREEWRNVYPDETEIFDSQDEAEKKKLSGRLCREHYSINRDTGESVLIDKIIAEKQLRHEWINIYQDKTCIFYNEIDADMCKKPNRLRREHYTMEVFTGERRLIAIHIDKLK
jgi:hypothetical protein